MTTANDARKAHKILDDLLKGNMVLDEEREFLRRALPELPKQKTLEEIIAHVRDAWVGANDNDWAGNSYDRDISIEDWMAELYIQINGLKDAPAAVPALPAGMRLADHEELGRVVVSPRPDTYLLWEISFAENNTVTGAGLAYVGADTLTFLDTEPAEPAHPEFLETEADYEDAPEGTIVAKDDISTAWIKRSGAWKSTDGDRGVRCPNWKVGHRIILRWGWKK